MNININERFKILPRTQLLKIITKFFKKSSVWGNIKELHDRIWQLLCRSNNDNPMHFHFSDDISIGNIQVFAMVVKQILQDDFYISNIKHLDCEFPKETSTYDELKQFCQTHKYDAFFYVTTPKYKEIKYITEQNRQIPHIDVVLYTKVLQNIYLNFTDQQTSFDDVANKMITSFICLNNAIMNYFYFKADDNDRLNWNTKYSPCFIDLENCRQLRGKMALIKIQNIEEHSFICQKYISQSFAYQCRFLSFWACLVNISSFPQLNAQTKEVINHFIDYLLKNYANIFLYDVVVEGNATHSVNINDRGSEANTTRIKIYFTDNDNTPCLMRLDLPHINHPYVHLNIQKGTINEHIRLSENAEGTEYDCIFDDLTLALRTFDYFSSVCKHSNVADDKQVINEMKYRTAMLHYVHCAMNYLILGEKFDSLAKTPFMQLSRITLISLLKEENMNISELINYNPYELLFYADVTLDRKHL